MRKVVNIVAGIIAALYGAYLGLKSVALVVVIYNEPAGKSDEGREVVTSVFMILIAAALMWIGLRTVRKNIASGKASSKPAAIVTDGEHAPGWADRK